MKEIYVEHKNIKLTKKIEPYRIILRFYITFLKLRYYWIFALLLFHVNMYENHYED